MPTRTRKPAKQSAQSSTRVTQTRHRNKVKEEDNTLEDSRESHMLDYDPAFVRIGAGVTRNLGDFESLRVDVSMTMPCHPDDVDEVADDLAERVSDRLNDEVDQYLSDEVDED